MLEEVDHTVPAGQVDLQGHLRVSRYLPLVDSEAQQLQVESHSGELQLAACLNRWVATHRHCGWLSLRVQLPVEGGGKGEGGGGGAGGGQCEAHSYAPMLQLLGFPHALPVMTVMSQQQGQQSSALS